MGSRRAGALRLGSSAGRPACHGHGEAAPHQAPLARPLPLGAMPTPHCAPRGLWGGSVGVGPMESAEAGSHTRSAAYQGSRTAITRCFASGNSSLGVEHPGYTQARTRSSFGVLNCHCVAVQT